MKIVEQESGSTMIELAVVLPVILVMLLGVLNYGLVLAQNIAVADSARAGAEYATGFGNGTNVQQMQAVATATAGNVPNYKVTAVNVCNCSPGGAAVSCTSSCSGYGQPATYAQVTATATLPLVFGSSASIPVKSVAIVRVSCPSCQ